MIQESLYIYGTHAVTEALREMPQSVRKLFLVSESEQASLADIARAQGIAIQQFSPKSPPFIEKDANHQGVIAEILPEHIMLNYREFIETVSATPDTALVLLDEIEDPQNVGAIIRSAAAFGVAGILIPEHRQAQISGTVVKVSAGMTFRIPLVAIGNINTTLRDLKERGFWIYGLDETSSQPMLKETFDAAAVFVLGNEGRGIREKTRELCDILLSIPMHPRCESLNVAASTAITLAAWSEQHAQALHPKEKKLS